MAFYLTDDGTMDTVVCCENCGREIRYNYASGPFADEDDDTDDETAYDEFIAYALEDAEDTHECPNDRRISCDQCAIVSIQGMACHEHGCPNARTQQENEGDDDC